MNSLIKPPIDMVFDRAYTDADTGAGRLANLPAKNIVSLLLK
jgi:hypothetical protein